MPTQKAAVHAYFQHLRQLASSGASTVNKLCAFCAQAQTLDWVGCKLLLHLIADYPAHLDKVPSNAAVIVLSPADLLAVQHTWPLSVRATAC